VYIIRKYITKLCVDSFRHEDVVYMDKHPYNHAEIHVILGWCRGLVHSPLRV